MKIKYLFLFFFTCCMQAQIKVTIDPTTFVSIKDHLELNRLKYFNLSSSGKKFEEVIGNPARVLTYLDAYGMSFGRELGMLHGEIRWGNSVFEDPARPGYTDLTKLRNKLNIQKYGTQNLKNRWTNLDVASHDRAVSYPDFMGLYAAPRKETEMYPTNTEAAAELAVNVLKYKYDDFSRPATYEIVNEPHWSVITDQRLADLHTAIHRKAKLEKLSTKIGGPCISVAYYYKRNYTALSGITKFIDNTKASLDFYSFHTYDFMRWNSESNNIEGRITSGLPLEGVIDALQNYMVNQYDKEIPIVVSEHGGYLYKNPENVLSAAEAESILGLGSGFDYEMKQRSVGSRIMTKSLIANTLVFMNNPHVIQKATPFILLETTSWNPKYYASLLVPEKFTKGNPWVETQLINFYKFFAEVKGKRIFSACKDPDIQLQSFLSGKNMFVILNNLGTKDKIIDFDFLQSNYSKIKVTRHGQNNDFTPYFTIDELDNVENFVLKSTEAVVLKITYPDPINTKDQIDITPYYASTGNEIIPLGQSITKQIDIPEPEKVVTASLRIGIGREATDTDRDLNVTLNGVAIAMPMETFSKSLQDQDYGSTKIAAIDPKLLKSKNIIQVSFPDGKIGGLGSVVLRAGKFTPDSESLSVKENKVQDSFSIYPNPSRLGDPLQINLNKRHGKVSYFLVSITGSILSSGTYNNVEKFQIPTGIIASEGIYFAILQADDKPFVNKIIFKKE